MPNDRKEICENSVNSVSKLTNKPAFYYCRWYPVVLRSDASSDVVEVGEAAQGLSKNDRV